MIVFNKKKYRLINFQEDIFLIDTNSFWWSCLCGLGIWYMPMKAIKVQKSDICQIKQVNVLNTVLGLISLIIIIICYSIGGVFQMRFPIVVRVLLEMISFTLLIGIKYLLNRYEQQRMNRQIQQQNIIVQICVKSKWIIIKSMILDLFLQGLIPLSTVLIFIFSDNANVMFFISLLGIWIFFIGWRMDK